MKNFARLKSVSNVETFKDIDTGIGLSTQHKLIIMTDYSGLNLELAFFETKYSLFVLK